MNNLIEITGILSEASIRVSEVTGLTLILTISGQKYEFAFPDATPENAGNILTQLQKNLFQKISISGDPSNSSLEVRLAHSIIEFGESIKL